MMLMSLTRELTSLGLVYLRVSLKTHGIVWASHIHVLDPHEAEYLNINFERIINNMFCLLYLPFKMRG